MPKINSLEVVHQDTNKDSYQNLHDILVALNQSLAVEKEVVDGEARVSIENLLEMYVNDKEAFLRSLRTLTAQFSNSQAQYSEEILLLASQLEAQARRTTTLTAQTQNNIASVREYSEAVASEVARKTSTYSQDTAPTENLVYGDLWIDTNDNNRMYSWNGIVWVEVTKLATFRQASAPSSAAIGDIWMDTDDNNKMYRWSGSSWVVTDDLRIAKTYARWGVNVNANGHIAGIQLNADDTGTSEFTVLADSFKVYNPSISNSEVIFKVEDGVVTPKNIRINDSGGNWILKASASGSELWKPTLFLPLCGNSANPGLPGLRAYSSTSIGVEAILGEAANEFGQASTSHGIRGTNVYTGTSGLIGVANGYDFYAEGTGTNYGPFTGAHDALMPVGSAYEVGDIVVDTSCVVKKNVSSVLCSVETSTSVNQKGTVGVIAKDMGLLKGKYPPAAFGFTNITSDEDGNAITPPDTVYDSVKETYNYITINALGEGQVNVCGENGNISRGDLIVSSSLPGKGMKQADDIIRSYTVAKAREDVTFSSPTEVKQVACIYLCG